MSANPTTPEPDYHQSGVSKPTLGSSLTEVLLDRVGKKISTARRARNMTQSELARLSSIQITTIFTAENGIHNTSLVTLAKIAAALEVDLRDLMPDRRASPSAGKGLTAPTETSAERLSQCSLNAYGVWQQAIRWLKAFSRQWRL